MNDLIARRPRLSQMAKAAYFTVVGHPTMTRRKVARLGLHTLVVRLQVDMFLLEVAVLDRILGADRS